MSDDPDRARIQADNNSIAIGEINISGTVTGNISMGHTIIQAADAQLRHDLGILLKNVETTWIKGVLERSVHEAALLELGMEIREEAVDNPWRLIMEGPGQTRETLPRGKSIKDIFYEANGLLLILGEPGSGKTTTLLQLARDLIAEVDQAFTQPVPVIFNLSTWTNKEQPLNEWLVAELNSKYRLPKKDGQKWLEGRRILPLLDGLDEVKSENRAACVEKINQLVKDYGLQGVVCSRIQDYMALKVRLGFYRAIYIQPLTPEQVDEYVVQADDKLASLRAILQADQALRSMAQSPLILSIMSLAYQNTSAEDLSDPGLHTDKARRQHLFDTYIARMFNRKVGVRPYDDELTKQSLSWLAQNMQRHNQEVFLIEGLQPSWLPARRWQWLYVLVSRMISGLGLGLMVGPVVLIVLLFTMFPSGLIITWPIVGLSLGLIDVLRIEWLRKRRGMRNFSTFWWSLIYIVVVCLISALIFGLKSGISDRGVALFYGLLFGLPFGLIFGLRGGRRNLEDDIQTVESLRWSWRMAARGGLIGGTVGLISVLIAGLSTELLYGVLAGLMVGLYDRPVKALISGDPVTLGSILTYGSIFVLGAGLSGAIFNGLSSEIIETKSVPNQGIRLSNRNAFFGGLIAGLGVALSLGLIFMLSRWLSEARSEGFSVVLSQVLGGLLSGLPFGLIVGPIGALWYGGLDVIQHYTLRLILVIQGNIPRNYAHFLDYAVDRIFLQKVGGGYRFIHRLLLEHFAEMDHSLKKA